MSAVEDIEVSVTTTYVEAQSDPAQDRYVFAYTINILNRGTGVSQLRNRHWYISDAHGEVEEVQGEGVVGQQPRLKPGEAFQYTSGAILKTPVGAMHGSYEFASETGDLFDVPIAPFSLCVPNMVH